MTYVKKAPQSENKHPVIQSAGESAVLEAAVASSLDGIQVFGGYGFMTGFEMERDLRDAVGGKLYSGTVEIQRNIIARMIGLPPSTMPPVAPRKA